MAKVQHLFQAEPSFRDRVSYRLRLTPSLVAWFILWFGFYR